MVVRKALVEAVLRVVDLAEDPLDAEEEQAQEAPADRVVAVQVEVDLEVAVQEEVVRCFAILLWWEQRLGHLPIR
ncbi:hypothetical protein C5Y97_10525 [Blastopirellula marina]|uniref:Uncharacterized protein n=1 Tax=Blastopirellula marina TaxID=124 RepID=A0A2S8G209_9BACT|nr:hypothetical protein C5Y98_10515 [Blastopirellula marina]PTL45136.1 hypothetical protein C5Y97_10525 [Blastopirellula marina]